MCDPDGNPCDDCKGERDYTPPLPGEDFEE